MQKEWSWRDSGQLNLPLKIFNSLGELVNLGKKGFNPDQLVSTAMEKAALNDLGDNSFREGLEILCQSYSSEGNLNTLGRVAAQKAIIDTLIQRLRLVEWEKQHLQVIQQSIASPWIVTGLPRSGTSLMSSLLDLDSDNRSPTVWETETPMPPATLASRYTDPRIAQTTKNLAQMNKIAPSLPAIHVMEAMLPQECLLLTRLDFRSLFFQSFSPCPSYGEWYVNTSMISAYNVHKRILKAWQNEIATKCWALKAPNHLHGIDDLLQVYPDAKMVWMHRDPVKCIPSITSLMLTLAKPFTRTIDPTLAGAHYNWMYHTGIEQTMAYDSRQQNRNWCYHLDYAEFIQDPLAAMQKLYAFFGQTVSPEHQQRINTWLKQRPKNAFGKHTYPLQDFGFDKQQLRDDYADYINRYKVTLED